MISQFVYRLFLSPETEQLIRDYERMRDGSWWSRWFYRLLHRIRLFLSPTYKALVANHRFLDGFLAGLRGDAPERTSSRSWAAIHRSAWAATMFDPTDAERYLDDVPPPPDGAFWHGVRSMLVDLENKED